MHAGRSWTSYIRWKFCIGRCSEIDSWRGRPAPRHRSEMTRGQGAHATSNEFEPSTFVSTVPRIRPPPGADQNQPLHLSEIRTRLHAALANGAGLQLHLRAARDRGVGV